jgi:hypothetical protein
MVSADAHGAAAALVEHHVHAQDLTGGARRLNERSLVGSSTMTSHRDHELRTAAGAEDERRGRENGE